MTDKYELKEIDGELRIVALRDFDCGGHYNIIRIHAGDVGGIVTAAGNLEQGDDSWISYDSVIDSMDVVVTGSSYVSGSYITGHVRVSNSQVLGSRVSGSIVIDRSEICDSIVRRTDGYGYNSFVTDSYIDSSFIAYCDDFAVEGTCISNSTINADTIKLDNSTVDRCTISCYTFSAFAESMIRSTEFDGVDTWVNFHVGYGAYVTKVVGQYGCNITIPSQSSIHGEKIGKYPVLSMDMGKYRVTITDDVIIIGCQRHPIDTWPEFTLEEIDSMEPGSAIDFYNSYVPSIVTIAKNRKPLNVINVRENSDEV